MGYYVLNPEMQVKLMLAPNSEGEWLGVALLADAVGRGWLDTSDS